MPKVRHSSITAKLTRMNMLVSGTALLTACAAFVAYDIVSFRASMVHNLSIQAQITGTNSVSALVFNDPRSAEKTVSALKAAPNVVTAAIYASDGHPFAAYSREAGIPYVSAPVIPLGEGEAHWFRDGQLELVRPVVFDGKRTGTVYIRSDLREMTARLKRFVGIAAAVLFVCLLGAFLVGSAFQRSVAEPIVHLAEISRIVSRNKNYSLRAKPTGNGDEPDTLITSFNDMLQRIQEHEEALRQAQAQLEQRVEERTAQLAIANKELEAFSYSVSHDLRAPLRSIDGFSLALFEDYGDRLDEGGKDYLQRVRSATQRMGTLIDDLLNLSRMTRADIRKERVSLSDVARSVVAGLQEALPNRRIEFRIEDRLEARADPRLVRVVLENLIGNACKFTSKRDFPRIDFGRAQDNANPAYYIRDNGAGFDPAYASKLFGAFQRLHDSAEFPGTGIGLATVQRIVHRHGGRIWAEGAVGKGATFYFTL